MWSLDQAIGPRSRVEDFQDGLSLHLRRSEKKRGEERREEKRGAENTDIIIKD